MKVFFGTLAAILVAALIIGFVAFVYRGYEASVKDAEDLRQGA
jgi:hypothetical protein